MASFVIFGAGKIARGFIGHLLYRAGHTFTLVERDEGLVRALNERGRYYVNVLGAPERCDWVSGFTAVALCDGAAVQSATRGADGIFTAVGGKNLPAVAGPLADALLAAQPRVLNVITCENWKQPAEELARAVSERAPGLKAGFAEAVVMRSAIEPDARTLEIDPLAVSVQDYWRLPVDAGGLIAPLPDIPGVEPIHDFAGFLERKFYTYNAANGTASYVGALLHHTYIADAAHDPRITALLDCVYRETGQALARKHGVPLAEQMAFARTSLQKLQDRVIVDTVERNARDPLRKLGPDDRLVGAARLAQSQGIVPEGLATAIAAALHYRQPGDPSAQKLAAMMDEEGSAAVLEKVCRLASDDPLYRLVLEKEQELREKGWIA